MQNFTDHQINVLIVEDNEDDLFFIKKALIREQYILKVIMSGIEAYEYLINPEILPDIVLLDNKLPGMDGIEILEKISAINQDYSFIFLSVDNSIKTVVKAMKAGALDFIVKSVDLKNELPEKIEKVYGIHQNKIEKKRLEQELIEAKEKAEESQKKYEMLFNTITEGVALNEIVYNEKHEMIDYQILEVNNAFYNVADYSSKQVIGNFATKLYGMSPEFIKSFWDNHIKQKETVYSEMYSPISNKCFYISTSPFINDRFVTVFFDITNLKKTENELIISKENAEENEEKYKNAAADLNKAQSVAKVGSWKWYINENRLVWSDEMYKIFGITENAFTGNLSEVIQQSIHPEDRAKVEESNNGVIEKGTPTPLEYRLIMPDESIKFVWAEAGELIRDKNLNPSILSGIVQDITEYKKTEEKLRQATNNWQTTFDAIDDHIILLTPNHEIIEINKAGLISLNKNRNEVIGQKCYHIMHNSNCPIQNCPCDISLQDKRVVVNEYLHGNRTFELTAWPVLDENDNLTAFTHIIKDITTRKNSEVALQKSESNLEEAQRIAKIGSWEWDMVSNTVYWSKEMYQVYDLDPTNYDFKPETLLKVIHPDDIGLFTNSMNNNLIKGNSPVLEYRVIHKDGSVHIIFAQGSTQFGENGKPLKSFGTAQDITELKIVQQELIKAKEYAEENERRYKLIFESAGTANAIFDTKCILILQNQLSKEFLGLGEKGGIGLTVFEVFGEKAGKAVFERMKRVIQTGISEVFETEFDLPTGKNWFKSTYQPVFDENKKVISVQIISQNITEIKKAEQETKRAFDIVQNIQTGLYIYHLENVDDDRTLRMVYANPASAHSTGVPAENLLGKTLDENFPGLRSKGIPQQFAEVVRTGNLLDIKDILYGDERVNDAYFIVKAFPLPGNHVGVAFDNITESMQAEEALRQSEDNYRRFMDESTLGIRIITKQGATIYINKSLLHMYGFESLKEFQETPISLRYTTEEQKRHKERKENRKLGKDLTSEYEINIISKNREIRNVQVIRKEIIWDKTMHFQIIYQDITDRKKAEDALLIAKKRAEESEQLKTAFLHNMSHEIRTPMNAICGFSSMLDRPNLSEDKRKSFTSIIINNSNQLLSIVNDILIISSVETKQEKINIQKICINNIIIDLLAIFKPQAHNQNISLFAKQELNDNQSEIYTDKTKITQILTNLITNALKFTHNGFVEFGYTLVETQNIASLLQQTQNIASLQQIQFYVKDTGIGIKPDLLEKIFERFRQADISINKKYGGTGLGLSISKGFVELLGGKIWVESELDKGSTFYFSIPYNPVHEHIDINLSGEQSKTKTTILIAEDEEYNYLYIEELLIDLDLKLIHAKDGSEVVEICRSNPDIGLILMDIKMPNMDGHEAAKIIKKFLPNVPIIAQSAYALEHEIKKYTENAFDDYITKPIDEEVLKQKVMKYIDIKF